MANFAKISETNEVLNVVHVDDKDTTNGKVVEEEAVGQQFLEKSLNWPAHLWIKTSLNTRAGAHRQGGTPLRGNYAGIGFTWDSVNEIFIAPKPYPSWVLDTTTYWYDSPIGSPQEDNVSVEIDGVQTEFTGRSWEEDNQRWVGVVPSSVAGQEETHLDKYVWNHTDLSWTFDSTVERVS